MAVEEVLAYEEGVRWRQAVIAGASGLLLLLSPLVGLAGVHPNVSELTLDLITIHRRFPLDLIAAVIQAFGLLALADTLGWLDGRARARNSRQMKWTGWVAMAGATMFAIGVAGGELAVSIVANKFVSSGSQTYLEANSLTSHGLIAILPIIEQLGALMLALGFILIALNAMRVGLLPRYLGYVGVAAGALVLFPVVPVPVVACLWLVGLAALLIGRWPGGTPPAWTTGTAVPWEPRVPPRAQASNAATPPDGRGARRGRPAPEPVVETRPPQVPERTRATTSKRKRKHRR
jgi:hypothetical protein